MPRQWRDKTRNTLTNIKAGCYRIDRLAVTLPFPERANEIMAFNGRWIKEFQRHSLKLDHGGYIQENRRGRTSHEYFPGMVVGKAGFSEQQGEVWGLHLAWSGNHRLRADCKSDGRRQVQAEALYFPVKSFWNTCKVSVPRGSTRPIPLPG